MNSVNVVTDIVINASVKEVATYAADPDNSTSWYVNIKSVAWKTAKPLTVGSQLAYTAHFLGRRLEYTYEITEFLPGEKMVMRTAQGPFPMETTYKWESIDGNKTKMTLRNSGMPSGLSKVFAPLMARAMRKANNKDLQKLKEILETRIAENS